MGHQVLTLIQACLVNTMRKTLSHLSKLLELLFDKQQELLSLTYV